MAKAATTGTRRPVREIRVGGISAAIWERNEDANGNIQYSVRINKSYRDKKSDEFKNTDYYFPSDLPKLVLAAEKAFEFISLKERSNAEF